MEILIRTATPDDIPGIHAIFSYYVLNTVASFMVHEPPLDVIRRRYETSRSVNLPFLVAIEQSSGQVLGYCSAGPFNGHMLGYVRSVELSLFCHSDYLGRSIGSKLLAELIQRLRNTMHIRREEGHSDKPTEVFATKLLAIMAVDDQAPGRGLKLRDWYIDNWGFEQAGRLKGIGWKNGRELDTIFLLKDLGA